ncbi:hypothetical protein RAS1_09360 [Phycisphaerae bacterium RAS1]|nr:hypothetical protein RAS1_09360 [Phycisphaerae bacterium RAS1]
MAVNREPRVAADYAPGCSTLIRRTCLEVATRLGDFRAEMCVVGGLVPSLIVDQSRRPSGIEGHIGTIDLDLGLSIVVLDERLYEEIAKRLREAGFTPDANPAGNLTTQRWRSREGVTVDFLIPPTTASDKGGRLRHLEADFAAIVTPGLDLAFEDVQLVQLRDELPGGAGEATREIQVCGPAAFVVLKALAFDKRGKPKDAYDLCYVVRNHTDGVERIGAKLRSFGQRPDVAEAMAVLHRDFMASSAVGPVRVAEFLGGPNDELQADVAGFVRALLRAGS